MRLTVLLNPERSRCDLALLIRFVTAEEPVHQICEGLFLLRPFMRQVNVLPSPDGFQSVAIVKSNLLDLPRKVFRVARSKEDQRVRGKIVPDPDGVRAMAGLPMVRNSNNRVGMLISVKAFWALGTIPTSQFSISWTSSSSVFGPK